MEEEDDRKSLIIFGRDVTKIPCFRKSFLFGITSGVVGGLATFMFTSKPTVSSHMSVATFVGATWTYWMYCRLTWSKEKLEAAKLQLLIEQHATFQGTPKEKEASESMKTLPLVDAWNFRFMIQCENNNDNQNKRLLLLYKI